MGNQFVGEFNQKDACELYLEDLGGISKESTLVNGRLMKSEKCWSEEGYYVVVKVYLKRYSDSNSQQSSKEDSELGEIRQQLIHMNQSLKVEKHPNILPYFRIFETDKAGYLVRQFCYMNLKHRISTRPFLTQHSKYWLTFQLLKGLTQLHGKNVNLYHGDLKGENVVLTGWDWLFLTDLAPFKPMYLSSTDIQSDFAYFFDTAERRKTTLAPERLGNESFDQNLEKSAQMMDVFSAGCVICQLFSDGRELFDFSQLLAYKNGDAKHISKQLAEIKDKNVQDLVRSMLLVDPRKRISSREALEIFNEFSPSYFAVLHKIFSKLLLKSCDERLDVMCDLYDDIVDVVASSGKVVSGRINSFIQLEKYLDEVEKESEEQNPVEEREEMNLDELLKETEYLNRLIREENSEEFEAKITREIYKFSVDDLHERTKKKQKKSYFEAPERNVDLKPQAREGMDVVASLVCSCVRNCKTMNLVIRGLGTIRKLAFHSTDFTRLQRLIPYTCSLLSKMSDRPALVKVGAIKTLAVILSQLKMFKKSEKNLFSDYILSALKPLVTDESEMVRIAVAEFIPFFAEQSKRFLEIEQIFNKADERGIVTSEYDKKLESLRTAFNHIIQDLTKDSCVHVKVALLKNMDVFCKFCGKRRATLEIIPILITFLNDQSWRLRSEFFRRIAGIAEHVSVSDVKKYVLPCVHTSLGDSEEFVVDSVIHSIVALTEAKLLTREQLFDTSKKIQPLLFHPNNWIRYDSIGFFVAMAKQLGTVDTYCFLIPELEKFLTCKISKITTYSLLEALKSPLSRKIYDASFRKVYQLEKVLEKKNDRKEWKEALGMDVQHEDVEKLETLKHFIFLTGNLRKRKNMKQSEQRDVSKHFSAKVRTLSQDVVTLKDMEFLRKTVQLPPSRGTNEPSSSALTPYRPRGELYCETREHKTGVTALDFYGKGELLISGGRDQNLKIWDTSGISMKKSFSLISKMNYQVDHFAGWITSICSFPDHPFIVFSTSAGFVQIFDAAFKQITETVMIRNDRCSFVPQVSSTQRREVNCAINVVRPFSLFNSTVVFAGTQNGVLHALDRTSHSEVMHLSTENSLKNGPISAVCGKDVWMVTGSKRGFLTLWDLRFQMPITTWRMSGQAINNIILKDFKESASIYIASEDIVEWNLESNKMDRIFRCSNPHEKVAPDELYKVKQQEIISQKKRNDLLQKAQRAFQGIGGKQGREASTVDLPKRLDDDDPFAIKEIESISWDDHETNYEIKCLHLNQEDGSFFCAGTDRKIRLWNTTETSKSYILSGLKPNEASSFKLFKTEFGLPIVQEYISERKNESEKHGAFNLPVSTNHLDSILDMKVIYNQEGVRKLVTADKVGVIKFWD